MSEKAPEAASPQEPVYCSDCGWDERSHRPGERETINRSIDPSRFPGDREVCSRFIP